MISLGGYTLLFADSGHCVVLHPDDDSLKFVSQFLLGTATKWTSLSSELERIGIVRGEGGSTQGMHRGRFFHLDL